MKKLLLCQAPLLCRLIFALLLAGLGVSANADFDEGLAAYNRGDYATALRELQPLAKQGHDYAQLQLGVMYHFGEGVPQDDKTAAKWIKRAAEQGNAMAQSVLGALYLRGEGVPQDDKMAAQWYRRAAEQGDAGAQFALGGMYYYGKGVPKDYTRAYVWMDIAASSGDETINGFSTVIQKTIKKQMTASQIAEAQKLARECVRKAYKDC